MRICHIAVRHNYNIIDTNIFSYVNVLSYHQMLFHVDTSVAQIHSCVSLERLTATRGSEGNSSPLGTIPEAGCHLLYDFDQFMFNSTNVPS